MRNKLTKYILVDNSLVDDLLLFQMFLSKYSDLPPQGFILLFHVAETIIQRILTTIHIFNFTQDSTKRDTLRSLCLQFLVFILLGVRNLSLDVFEKIWMALLKIWMRKLHLVLVEFQASVVNGRYLVESIHVQLSDEACHVVVLVVERQKLLRKLRLILNDEASSILQCKYISY